MPEIPDLCIGCSPKLKTPQPLAPLQVQSLPAAPANQAAADDGQTETAEAGQNRSRVFILGWRMRIDMCIYTYFFWYPIGEGLLALPAGSDNKP